MKKFFICIIMICIILYGCQKSDVDNIPSDEQEEFSPEEIEEKYNHAKSILLMILGKGLETDKGDTYTDERGLYDYYAVNFNNINTVEELKSYLNTIFSPDITSELVNIGVDGIFDRYIEKDNKLYQIDYDYSISLINYDIEEVGVKAEKLTDEKYVYYVEKSISDTYKKDQGTVYIFEYIYEYVDGKWIFTSFPILKPYMDLDYSYTNYTGKYEVVSEVLNDTVIENSFNIAKEIYAWFVVSDGITDEYYRTISIGERSYHKVYNRNIKSMDDLLNYMKTVFSDEVIDSFIITNVFIEIDNDLYVSQHLFPIRAYGITETYIEKINESKYVYSIELSELSDDWITYTSNYIIKEYPYEYVDGRWVFTDFPSPLR